MKIRHGACIFVFYRKLGFVHSQNVIMFTSALSFLFLLRIRFMHSDRLSTHDFHVLMLNYRLSGILKRYMPISFSKISLASSKCAAIYSGVWASEPRVIYLPPKSLYSLRISLDGCVSGNFYPSFRGHYKTVIP